MKRLISEFEESSYVLLAFPHEKSDWKDLLEEVTITYIDLIQKISKYQKVIIICNDIVKVKSFFKDNTNMIFIEYETDDTWIRDFGYLSLFEDGRIVLYNFEFNAWGDKFNYKKDNLFNNYLDKYIKNDTYNFNFILEGGSIESNSNGLLLSTSECIYNNNRNSSYTKSDIDNFLKKTFSINNFLILEHGYIKGDDTNSHIDTLVRFTDESTLVYVQCNDINDEHYIELKYMEDELKVFELEYKLKLYPIPLPKAIYFNKQRLPATYANFLILNDVVFMPTYNCETDSEALNVLEKVFKTKDIIEVDSRTLIKQGGSLHCSTMQLAKGVELI